MWTFEQSTGKVYQDGGQSLAIGYAGGNCGKHPEGKNNPAMQDVPDIGPIPQGLWGISAPHDHPKLGKYAMALTPMTDTNTFGRSGFYMHGDSIPHPGEASDGCPVVPKFARERVWESGDHVLNVVSGL